MGMQGRVPEALCWGDTEGFPRLCAGDGGEGSRGSVLGMQERVPEALGSVIDPLSKHETRE